MRRAVLFTMAFALLGMPSTVLAQRGVPTEHTLSSGWEMRVEAAAPAPPQPAPPEETEPDGSDGASVGDDAARAGRPVGRPLAGHPRAERVRLARAAAALSRHACAATASTFVGPATPRGFSWLIRFDSVRRNAAVILNGRRIGRNVDPYTPFTCRRAGSAPGGGTCSR